MSDKPAAETNPTDESHTDDARSTAVRAVIDALLGRVRRVVDRPTAAAAARPPASPVVTDGGQNNAKVIGHNKESGQTVGVWGEVDSADGCGLATPDDVRIDGTIDTNETDFTVEAGTTTTADAKNVVLGHASNEVLNGAVGAVIAGGGDDDGDTSEQNRVYGNYGVVGGGASNDAGDEYESDPSKTEYTTISGGSGNDARGYASAIGGGLTNLADGAEAVIAGGRTNETEADEATIGGGAENTVSGERGTVGGGDKNTAGGLAATVPGGAYGAAESDNTFVWNDGTEYHDVPNAYPYDGLSSDTKVDSEPVIGSQTFSVSAQGGVRFITGGSKVTYIGGGTAGWSNTSSRTAKTNIDPVDPQQVLDGVKDLEVATWEYEEDGDGAGSTHIGPMAEEFHSILDDAVGSSDDHINSINADGMLFAAVQGLAERLSAETDRLAAENDQLREELDAKDSRIDELEAENDELRSRLADIEAHLGLGETETAPAQD